MSFIPALHALRISLEMTLNGQVVVNVFYGKKVVFSIPFNLTSIGETLRDWWSTNYGGLVTADMALTAIRLRDMSEEAGEILEFTDGLPITGTLEEEAAPNNVALVQSFRTGVAGKSFRGRIYAAGIPNSYITNNNVSAGYQGGWADGIIALQDALITENMGLVVASFHHDNAPRAEAVLTPVTSVVINTRVDTQRRRLPVA